jgi:hypothetical protein
VNIRLGWLTVIASLEQPMGAAAMARTRRADARLPSLAFRLPFVFAAPIEDNFAD